MVSLSCVWQAETEEAHAPGAYALLLCWVLWTRRRLTPASQKWAIRLTSRPTSPAFASNHGGQQ